MTTFIQTLLNTLAVGGVYALVALGYTMVYGVLKFINFAHANVIMVGGWTSFLIAKQAGWTDPETAPYFALPLVLLLTMAVCAALGVAIEFLAYRPLRHAPRINILITAIGVSIFLQNAAQLDWIFGTSPVGRLPLIPDRTVLTIQGVHLQLLDTVIVGTTITLMIALEFLVFRTPMGRAMRAVSWNTTNASLMGISPNRTIAITFVIGSSLAAAAGVLLALKYSVAAPGQVIWVTYGLKSFVAAVVGGIGNVHGAVLGGFLIAAVENFGVTYIDGTWRDAYVFAVLIAVLLIRPSGILGKTSVEKL